MAQRLVSHIFFVTLHSQIRDVRQSSIDTHYLFRAIHCHSQIRDVRQSSIDTHYLFRTIHCHSQIRRSDREPASQTLAICIVRCIAVQKK